MAMGHSVGERVNGQRVRLCTVQLPEPTLARLFKLSRTQCKDGETMAVLTVPTEAIIITSAIPDGVCFIMVN